MTQLKNHPSYTETYVNNLGAIVDLKSPIKPPQVVTKPPNQRKPRASSAAKPVAPDSEKPKRQGPAPGDQSLRGERGEAHRQVSPKLGRAADLTAVGEVYWATAPASKYFRTEGSSNPSSPALDYSQQVDDILASLAPTSARLPRSAANRYKAEPLLELGRQAFLARSLSIPKLPKAVELEKLEPSLDLDARFQATYRAELLSKTNQRSGGEAPDAGAHGEQTTAAEKTLAEPKSLLRSRSVPASIYSNLSTGAASDGKLVLEESHSTCLLEAPSPTSTETIVNRFDTELVIETAAVPDIPNPPNTESAEVVVPRRGTHNPFYVSLRPTDADLGGYPSQQSLETSQINSAFEEFSQILESTAPIPPDAEPLVTLAVVEKATPMPHDFPDDSLDDLLDISALLVPLACGGQPNLALSGDASASPSHKTPPTDQRKVAEPSTALSFDLGACAHPTGSPQIPPTSTPTPTKCTARHVSQGSGDALPSTSLGTCLNQPQHAYAGQGPSIDGLGAFDTKALNGTTFDRGASDTTAPDANALSENPRNPQGCASHAKQEPSTCKLPTQVEGPQPGIRDEGPSVPQPPIPPVPPFVVLDDGWEDDFDDIPDDELGAVGPPQPETFSILDDFDVDFDDLDFPNFTIPPAPPQMSAAHSSHLAQPPPSLEGSTRVGDSGAPDYYQCLVVEVQFQYFSFQDVARGLGLQKPEKVLRLYEQRCCRERVVHLRESWIDTPVQVGDCVNVIGAPLPGSGGFVVDDAAGYLVLNPNLLISTTHLADSFSCMRRAILSSRVRSPETSDAGPVVFGNMLHTLLQRGLLHNRFDPAFLADATRQILKNGGEGLYLCDLDEGEAENYLQVGALQLRGWAERYVGPSPRPEATFRSAHQTDAAVSVTRVLGVEEIIWSPMFGLKGKVDASVLTVEGGITRTCPLEFKTGRASHSILHRAQTLLYTLMMSGRYRTPIAAGWLLYLKGALGGDMMTRIDSQRLELRGLVQSRNTLTTFLVTPDAQLPALIRNPHACKWCPALNACATYHCAVEGGTSESSQLGELFSPRIDHITPNHMAFFRHWDRLLTLEEGKVYHLRQQIWCQTSLDRSKAGDCLGGMVVLSEHQDPASCPPSGKGPSEDVEDLVPPQWYRCTMVKATPEALPPPDGAAMSLAERLAYPERSPISCANLGVGDPIVISVDAEPGAVQHVALAIGFVKELHPDRIVLSLDRKLKGPPIRSPNFHPTAYQAFEGERDLDFQPVGSRLGNPVVPSRPPPSRAQTLYRIDKDEMATGMLLVRNNLVELMVAPTGAAAHLRSLVVDLVAPSFRAIPAAVPLASPGTCSAPSSKAGQPNLDAQLGDLNADQRLAIKTVLSAQDYTLILGMPGTGKTTTIARLVQLLVQLNHTVLIAAHTHSAVDTILCKLHALGLTSFLRLGNGEKVHPRIRPYTPPPHPSVATLRRLYDTTPVVATTCLGISHPLFLRRQFECCIIDEASQVTLPICVGPLRFARRFVLVGDHYQLPPLVRNPKAKRDGLATSLFKRLSEAHLRSVVHLRHQYRMNQDIMDVANLLVYQGALRCGTHAIATSALSLPHPAKLRCPQLHDAACLSPAARSACWILHAVDPSTRVVFLDTDGVPGLDEKSGDLTSNPTEVALTTQLVQALTLGGIDGGQIGILSPYRAQLAPLIAAIQPSAPSVEVLTVDRAQGRDKDCIIISMVRSNPGCNVGELLRDWRRLNVAFTRARHKLIVVGSASTLSSGGGAILEAFLTLLFALTRLSCTPSPKMPIACTAFRGPPPTALQPQPAGGPHPEQFSRGATLTLSWAVGRASNRPTPQLKFCNPLNYRPPMHAEA
ncbi:DNA replication endonuclease-helicase Dna2 [Massospora cicadina]|nr:DNA replication endonuclease-helicase Dna2 [Massospora cicadina]